MPNLAFPYDNDTPTKITQLLIVTFIPFYIIHKLVLPKLTVAFRWNKPFAALVRMPEATIDKDNCFILGQNDIGFAREVRYIFAIPKPLAK